MFARSTRSIAALAVAAGFVTTVWAQGAAGVSVSSNDRDASREVRPQTISAVETQDPPLAPEAEYRAQYQALMKEFSAVARGLWEAKTDEDRKAVAERAVKLSPRFLELAEQDPGSAVARDCLVQLVAQEIWLENNTSHPGREGESLEDQAIALLLKHHLASDQLGEACTRMCYGFRKQCEVFLRTVAEKSPHREVQGLACLRLAQFLNGRLRRLDLIDGQPEMARRYAGLFGESYVEELRLTNRVEAIKEVEALFMRAADKFGDIALPWDGNVAATAKSELVEIRTLALGMQAPEIEGEDSDGKQFKLSDYRGKVVLLYFWSEY